MPRLVGEMKALYNSITKLVYAFSMPVHWTSIYVAVFSRPHSHWLIHFLSHHFLQISFSFLCLFFWIESEKKFLVKVKFYFEIIFFFLLFHFWFLFPFLFVAFVVRMTNRRYDGVEKERKEINRMNDVAINARATTPDVVEKWSRTVCQSWRKRMKKVKEKRNGTEWRSMKEKTHELKKWKLQSQYAWQSIDCRHSLLLLWI